MTSWSYVSKSVKSARSSGSNMGHTSGLNTTCHTHRREMSLHSLHEAMDMYD